MSVLVVYTVCSLGTNTVYSGPYILRPPFHMFQPQKYGLKFKVVL